MSKGLAKVDGAEGIEFTLEEQTPEFYNSGDIVNPIQAFSQSDIMSYTRHTIYIPR